MSLRPLFVLCLVALLGLVSACTSTVEAPAEEAGADAAETETAQVEAPVSGVTAYWEMYELAFQWSSDLQPLWLRSGTVEAPAESADSQGLAPVWTAMFVSPSKREAREFTYRAVGEGMQRKGVSAKGAQAWSGPTDKGEPFSMGDVQLDSSEALAKAQPEAESWLKSHADAIPSFYLGKESRFPDPVWAVLWGPEGTGRLVIVNAKTGEIDK